MSKYNKSFRDRIAARKHALGRLRGNAAPAPIVATEEVKVEEDFVVEVVEEDKPKAKTTKKKSSKKKKSIKGLFKRKKKGD